MNRCSSGVSKCKVLKVKNVLELDILVNKSSSFQIDFWFPSF